MSVYFVRCRGTNLVKIGFTCRDMKERVAALQTCSPGKLEVLGERPEWGRRHEEWLHRRFAGYMESGEWFRMNPGLARVIALTDPSFQELAGYDRRLLKLCDKVGRVGGGERVCANRAWRGVKRLMLKVVGWTRKPAGYTNVHQFLETTGDGLQTHTLEHPVYELREQALVEFVSRLPVVQKFKHEYLSTQESYKTVYRTLYKLLPDCTQSCKRRGCR